MRVLDLVGDFPDVVVNVARVAVNNDDLAGGKSFVVFFCWSFFAAPLGRRIHPKEGNQGGTVNCPHLVGTAACASRS
jgi:hypothetical protein